MTRMENRPAQNQYICYPESQNSDGDFKSFLLHDIVCKSLFDYVISSGIKVPPAGYEF